ncbi:unnamed protein product [Absidia cylindrospora]
MKKSYLFYLFYHIMGALNIVGSDGLRKWKNRPFLFRTAAELTFEHQGHSMILDPEDRTWLKYFTASELEELTTTHPKCNFVAPPKFTQLLEGIGKNKERQRSCKIHTTPGLQ